MQVSSAPGRSDLGENQLSLWHLCIDFPASKKGKRYYINKSSRKPARKDEEINFENRKKKYFDKNAILEKKRV